jgi:long-subunit fatty acid transport protein
MTKSILAAAAAVALGAGAAQAGSVQRDGDRSQILFEKGRNYVEFSVVNVAPDLSGTTSAVPLLGIPAGVPSGDIANTYQSYSLGWKSEINDRLSFAIVANNPVGADITYPGGLYPFGGSTAKLESTAVTGYLKYKLNDRVSVYGGARLQALKGNVVLGSPVIPVAPYTLAVDSDYAMGYVLGAAYERPEIAMRVALTYESKIDHEFRDSTGAPFGVEIPQAVTLHARSGIAANTIVFGSIRWQEWSQFRIAPADFLAHPLNLSGLPLAFGADDYWTYELGVGRRFTDNWSGALTVGYEPQANKPVGNLEAKDGFISYGLAVKYSTEAYDITLGVKYIELGDATTTTIGSNFSGNDAIAVGLKMGWRF